jgi:hypothetical protein
VADAQEFLAGQCADLLAVASQVDGKFVSGFIRAVKPGAQRPAAVESAAVPRQAETAACCGSACCGPRA